ASYSAADIQALLSKVTAENDKVSADMVNAAKNATVTGAGIQDAASTGAGKWSTLAKSSGNAVANAGKPLTLQIGDTSDNFNQLRVGIKDCHVAALGLTDMKIGDQDSAAKALDRIKSAINYVSDVRGTLGATQNRLDHTINNLSVMQENIQDAESTIRDTDVADEMMAYTKNNILIQSAQAMLAQANQVPQGVLQLLQ
ncbi:MAG: flagellin, partial [Flavonifractor plautii]